MALVLQGDGDITGLVAGALPSNVIGASDFHIKSSVFYNILCRCQSFGIDNAYPFVK
jgi:hypothetical protein